MGTKTTRTWRQGDYHHREITTDDGRGNVTKTHQQQKDSYWEGVKAGLGFDGSWETLSRSKTRTTKD